MPVMFTYQVTDMTKYNVSWEPEKVCVPTPVEGLASGLMTPRLLRKPLSDQLKKNSTNSHRNSLCLLNLHRDGDEGALPPVAHADRVHCDDQEEHI